MTKHLWVLDIFEDVSIYLRNNDLPEAGQMVLKTAESIAPFLAAGRLKRHLDEDYQFNDLVLMLRLHQK